MDLNVRAVLLEALPADPSPEPPSLDVLRQRLVRRRHRRARTATVGVLLALTTLLAVLVGPLRTAERAPNVRAAHGPLRTAEEIGFTRLTLPDGTVAYAADGPLAVSPDGRMAYVGDPQRGLVTPVTLPGGRTERSIVTGRWGINAIAVAPDGRTAYVVDGGIVDALVPIDLATGTVGRPIHAGGVRALGSALAITPNGRRAYVDSLSESRPEDDERSSLGTESSTYEIDSEVVPVDLTTGRALPPLPLLSSAGSGDTSPGRAAEPQCRGDCAFGETIGAISVSASGATVYVTQTGLTTPTGLIAVGGGLYGVDVRTGRVHTVAGVTETAAAVPLALSPDGRTAYLGGGGVVTPVDLASGTVETPLPVLPAAATVSALAVAPDGGQLLVGGEVETVVVALRGAGGVTVLAHRGVAAIVLVPGRYEASPHR